MKKIYYSTIRPPYTLTTPIGSAQICQMLTTQGSDWNTMSNGMPIIDALNANITVVQNYLYSGNEPE